MVVDSFQNVYCYFMICSRSDVRSIWFLGRGLHRHCLVVHLRSNAIEVAQ